MLNYEIFISNQSIKLIHHHSKMKLRRRDHHQLFTPLQYHILKHNTSNQTLKKIRTMASLHTLNPETFKKFINRPEQNRNQSFNTKQSRMIKKNKKKHQNTKIIREINQIANVNTFKHLIQLNYMDNNQIKWAFSLRNHEQSKGKKSISQIPSTYYKTTQSSKVHHQASEVPSHINFNTFMHLTKKGQHPSMGLLKFETTLRQNDIEKKTKSPQLVDKEKSFLTIPVKDRHDYPKLLNSQSLKKKTINPEQDLETAFDGNFNYPAYTNRIIKQKNYNSIRQHMRNLPRSKINLPSLGWQTNLRFYEKDNKSNQRQMFTQQLKPE